MTDNPRRLVIPQSLAEDPRSYELVSAWATGTSKISVMTRTGTGLDQMPAIWGEILAAIAGNIALSVREMTGADPSQTMDAIKESLDRCWSSNAGDVGRHYPNVEGKA